MYTETAALSEQPPSPLSRLRSLAKPLIGVVTGIALVWGYSEVTYSSTTSEDAYEARLHELTAVVEGEKSASSDFLNLHPPHRPVRLPGSGKQVPASARTSIEQAAVKIGMRPKATPNAQPLQKCSGTKVRFGDRDFVLTAAHCFVEDLSEERQATIAKPSTITAMNITGDLAAYQYSILDLALPTEKREAEPLGYVTGIAVNAPGISDVALLAVRSEATRRGGFDSLPAIDIGRIVTDQSPPPLPGSEVALYGAPGASNSMPIKSTGIYLGRGQTDGDGTVADYVAINPSEASVDACNFGASGGSAAFAGKVFSGPFSFRNAIGYGVDRLFQVREISVGTSTLETRLQIEDTVGFTLGRQAVICGFNVSPSMMEFGNLAHSLMRYE